MLRIQLVSAPLNNVLRIPLKNVRHLGQSVADPTRFYKEWSGSHNPQKKDQDFLLPVGSEGVYNKGMSVS